MNEDNHVYKILQRKRPMFVHKKTLTMVWRQPFKCAFVVSVDIELVKQLIKINSILGVTKISAIENTQLNENDHVYKIL